MDLKTPSCGDHILHILLLLADSLMLIKEYKKGSKVFYSLSKHYNLWKVKANTPCESGMIFGVDEYIRTKASYAECLMNLGQT